MEENVPPMQFLLSSVAFYALMGVGSQVASSFLGVHPDVLDGTRALNLDTASLWTVPLLASLAFAITQADKFEFLGEVRDIFKVGVLPSLAPLGLPGVVALSLGAGGGEEQEGSAADRGERRAESACVVDAPASGSGRRLGARALERRAA